jgi:MYXO-CTERM domain-containing protein
MPSGKVLVVGGEDGTARLSTAEFYDPDAGGGVGAFSVTGALAAARSAHTATMLTNGKVLVVGGQGASGNLSTAEIFDPGDGSTGEFKSAGAMSTARTGHVASLLPDGKVLVAGGAPASALSTAELWNQPAIGDEAWRPVLSTVPATVTAGQSTSISGTGLTGISEASDGAPHSSATSYPIAVWMPAAGGWGTMGRMLDFTATSTNWQVPATALAGPGWLFAVTNAIPSRGMPVTLAPSAIATACSVDGECQSGFCASGFCCDRVCDAPCEACSAALKVSGADGVCGPVKSGTDPNNACPADPQATCQGTGVCDGLGACQRWASGTVCLLGSCSGFVLSPAFTCDGNGTCQPSTAVDCRPGRCDNTTKQCVLTCTTNSDCSTGSFCRAGTCLAPQPEGAICAADTECISVHCVDGVCCATPCDGLCQACTNAKKGGGDDGTCGNVADGFDPDSECTETAASTCQADGLCDGAGKCRLWSGSTPCGQTSCVDGTGVGDRSKAGGQFCDGLGTCTVKSGLECGLFKCAGDVCGTACTSATECLSAAYCDLTTTPGACKEKSLTGASCVTSEQCSSGFCVDGVCCNSPCQGQCEACNETEPGQCVAVTGAPRGERVPCAGDGTECDGACDGENRSACAYSDVETLCGEQTCLDDGRAARRVCDGRGACRAPADTSCAGFLCVDGVCNTTCSTDNDCALTYRCDTTQTPVACVPKGRGDCIVNDTVLKSPDGTEVPCAPFKCDPSEGLCLASCRSKADCTEGNECSSSGVCEAPFAVPSEDSSCGCRVAGSSPASNAVWGLATALLFALRLRRRSAMRAASGRHHH